MAGTGKPGRPRRDGGPDPSRSFRSGAVYDRAAAIAAERGTTITAVINAALSAYVVKHDHHHGTTAAYQRHQYWGEQPCDPCREAKRADDRDRAAAIRERGLAPDDPRHGTASAYKNRGCLCDKCSTAARGQREAAAREQRRAVKGRKLTAEQVARLRERAVAGDRVAALAREYGISRQTVYNYLRTETATAGGRKRALIAERSARLRERAVAGESKSALAREYGISYQTVCRDLSRSG